MTYRILVTGTRRPCTAAGRATIRAALNAAIRDLDPEQAVTVVHGNARGVDREAQLWAQEAAYVTPEPHPADWEALGRKAGPHRNALMVGLGADICLAFPDTDSVGTWDCVRKAAAAAIPVRIYPLQGAAR